MGYTATVVPSASCIGCEGCIMEAERRVDPIDPNGDIVFPPKGDCGSLRLTTDRSNHIPTRGTPVQWCRSSNDIPCMIPTGSIAQLPQVDGSTHDEGHSFSSPFPVICWRIFTDTSSTCDTPP